MGERCCSDCKFWEEDEGAALGLGECRRFPPMGAHPLLYHLVDYVSEIGEQLFDGKTGGAMIGDKWFKHQLVSGVNGDFAITSCEDWCGEFSPAPPHKEADGK